MNCCYHRIWLESCKKSIKKKLFVNREGSFKKYTSKVKILGKEAEFVSMIESMSERIK